MRQRSFETPCFLLGRKFIVTFHFGWSIEARPIKLDVERFGIVLTQMLTYGIMIAQ